ncbi:MAG: hypothetical protein M3N43_11225 [Actinomycetota bacterium]|nr:hypothetical protein [Actinomycetota bacterium]
MFVGYHTFVSLPMAEVENRLDELRSDLKSWAGIAYRDGEELRTRVGPSEGRLAKEVRLEIGMAEIHRAGLVYPISWSATGAEILFPKLSADLTISHVGSHQTRITLEGTYETPLGSLGRVVDRVVLRKIADATVKAWVDRLADALTSGHPVS